MYSRLPHRDLIPTVTFDPISLLRPPQDATPVRCLSFHPTGDYLAVGTDHTAVRVYDVATAQCYVNPFSREHHTNRVTSTQ